MKNYSLIFGDVFAMLVVTLIGFAIHDELNTAFIIRVSVLIFPLVVAWVLLSPWFGLFQPEITSNLKQVWRPALAMLFAAPLAAVLRGLILNAPIIPIFVVVLGVTSALGMLFWRGLFFFLSRKTR